MTVPKIRIQACNGAPINGRGEFVLYWMVAHRRTTWDFSLQLAVNWARQLNGPLTVAEALRCDYPWASDRRREGMGHLILGWRRPLSG